MSEVSTGKGKYKGTGNERDQMYDVKDPKNKFLKGLIKDNWVVPQELNCPQSLQWLCLVELKVEYFHKY